MKSSNSIPINTTQLILGTLRKVKFAYDRTARASLHVTAAEEKNVGKLLQYISYIFRIIVGYLRDFPHYYVTQSIHMH